MSRFTRPPFHKLSPFDIPRPVHPPSPPETEITAESVALPPMSIVSRDLHISQYTDMGASSSFTRVDTPESYHNPAPATELQSQAHTPNGRFRRPSNLAYLHPGSLRGDLRAAPRSATRWLVMVTPPPAVAREHSNSVFLNASSHTSQGVLLPLLPSLSGQLSAIAREFAFPSTTGICIYLQMSDGGVQFAPRISDESWLILWGSVFDERHGHSQMRMFGGLPIAGRIEFDLDLRRARWFDMWLASVRNSPDVGLGLGVGSVASASGPGSLPANHRHQDSRTTFDHAEESLGAGPGDDVSVTIQRRAKHVPRKLSLLDRIDLSSVRPLSRPERPVFRALSPTDAEQPRLALSPVAQTPIAIPVSVTAAEDDEPQTARRRVDIEKKVETWRASSTFAKSPLVVSTGQTALDPANMPNNVPLAETDVEAAEKPLNLEDFTWSISSAGPLSADYAEPISPYASTDRAPSVHLDARLEGSVCLTPTTCTSFGPPDYDPFSPIESLIDRLPSPDIAFRQLEDVPPTPTTATSWGPPSEWPGSPVSISRAPSIDIALRQLGSRPVTPTTATSWGAPSEWPESPAPRFRAPSVDVAMRELISRPVTPSTATSWGAPLQWPGSPATPFHVLTPGVGHMFFDGQDEEDALLEPGRILRSMAAEGDEEPHRTFLENGDMPQNSRPWKFVWPYTEASQLEVQRPSSVKLQPVYPCFSIYPAVYPHFDLYPTHTGSQIASDEQPPRRRGSHSLARVMVKRTEKPWDHVWPYQKVEDITRSVNVRLESLYPSFDLYPTVYPCFNLYPAKPVAAGSTPGIDVHLRTTYPNFSIYPAVYPTFEIYPGHVTKPQQTPQELISVHLEAAYPCLRPYPPVYPHFELYPASPVVKTSTGRRPPQKQALPSAAGSVPIITRKPWKHVWPYQQIEDVSRPVNVRLPVAYPAFNIYPTVYPYFDLYPASSAVEVGARYVPKTSIKRSPPPPKKRALPSSAGLVRESSPWKHVWPYQRVEDVTRSVHLRPEAMYPSFDLYPVVYPHFDLYPEKAAVAGTIKEVTVKLEVEYPSFSIYPATYPDFEIYPGDVIEAQKNPHDSLKVELSGPTYPSFNIYPAVYPYFDIYCSGVASTPKSWREPCRVELGPKYPAMNVYPAVYPYFDIYCSGVASTPEVWLEPCRVELEPKYPVMSVYPAVYPYFDIYCSGVVSTPEVQVEPCRVGLEPKYPVMSVYPVVYPYFDLYASGIATTPENWREPCRVELDAKYPVMNVYPAVYPYFDIYASGIPSTPEHRCETCRVELDAKYPTIVIYPAVYPAFDIYKTGQISDPTLLRLRNEVSTRLEVKYPSIDIYPAVYPDFDLYPSVHAALSIVSSPKRRARKTHQELVELVLLRTPKPKPTRLEPIIPQISVSSPVVPRSARRTHKELVELVFPPQSNVGEPPAPAPAPAPVPTLVRVRRLPLDIPQDVESSSTNPEGVHRSPSMMSAGARRSHIPVRPSDIRRSVSLGQATMSSGGVSRSQSLRYLSSVREEGATAAGAGARNGSTLGNASVRRPARDSIVLERARHWGSPAQKPPVLAPAPRTDGPSRVSMKDLSDFPMPPLPPLPNGQPASAVRADRPVAKLDRTKFPFR